MATTQELLYLALRRCGQLRPGYTSSAELLNDGLLEFQAMYDGWNAERTNAFSIPDYIYDASTATSLDGIYGENIQYTIGPVFTFTGTTTITSTTVTVVNTQGLNIGQYVTGTGIAADTTIQGISTNTSITLSAAATASGAVTLTITPSFTGPRPEAIIRMNLWMTSVSPTSPTRIPIRMISAEEFARISVLGITAINIATVCYYDPQFPQGVLNVWPPLNGNSLEIFTWGFLTPPVSLSTEMRVPPGYQDAIIYTLAQRLWPMLTRDVCVNKVSIQYLAGQAAIARNRIKAVNAPRPKLRNDFQGGKGRGVGVCDWTLLLAGQPY